ncbi:MAG TPA: hypothetical protein VFJ61_05560 [Solirubrobacterales bacterium]|nr:hypothetical protein [Solirubrobacterales bacterium]
MDEQVLEKLPGAEIVLPGIADLQRGRMSLNALAVQAAAPRLRHLGLAAHSAEGDEPAAHRLYQELQQELGDGAHSRYNAILRRVSSFTRAAERARVG